MRKRYKLFILGWLFCWLLLPKHLFAQQERVKITCICIDAGHGGSDPGAVNGKVKEKNITLDIALKLGELIRQHYPEVKIVYTRKKDVAVDLRERGRIANRANAQLFISIHVNSFKKNTAVKMSSPCGWRIWIFFLPNLSGKRLSGAVSPEFTAILSYLPNSAR